MYQMKGFEQFFHMLLFVMLCKVDFKFNCDPQMCPFKCELNEKYFSMVLFINSGSGRNPYVWSFK